MNDANDKYLQALTDMNRALLAGLEAAVTFMESWDAIESENKQTMIDSLKKLVAQGKMAFGEEPEET
jgi:hypothetical protein